MRQCQEHNSLSANFIRATRYQGRCTRWVLIAVDACCCLEPRAGTGKLATLPTRHRGNSGKLYIGYGLTDFSLKKTAADAIGSSAVVSLFGSLEMRSMGSPPGVFRNHTGPNHDINIRAFSVTYFDAAGGAIAVRT